MSTCSNRSFSDETVKNFSRVSTNICLTVSGSLLTDTIEIKVAESSVVFIIVCFRFSDTYVHRNVSFLRFIYLLTTA